MSRYIKITGTSPASATTAQIGSVVPVGEFASLYVYAQIQGGTGGTLDLYIQTSPDGGTTWVDYAAFAQLAAGAAQISRAFTVSRGAQQTTITAVGTGTSPALAANTVIGGDFGDRLRLVGKAGASTSAGATQTLLIIGTTPRR